jgi:hypothetical protein
LEYRNGKQPVYPLTAQALVRLGYPERNYIRLGELGSGYGIDVIYAWITKVFPVLAAIFLDPS